MIYRADRSIIPSSSMLTKNKNVKAPIKWGTFLQSYENQDMDDDTENLISLDYRTAIHLQRTHNGFKPFVGDYKFSYGYRYKREPGDIWKLMHQGGTGDCEDFALTMRNYLINCGYPKYALRVCTCRVPRRGVHAHLCIMTDKGDYISDILYRDIMPWKSMRGYRWYSRTYKGMIWHSMFKLRNK